MNMNGKKENSGRELASAFELMMQQLLRLGHTLPASATSLTPQQLKVLFTLDYLVEATPMAKIAAQLGVTPGTLTQVAGGLIRLKFLERKRAPDDDRVVKLSLTKEGHEMVEQIKKHRQEFFARICERLTASERKLLIQSHRHIFETYQRLLKN
jgi:DNA-binding MarR family transcriptional regulator